MSEISIYKSINNGLGGIKDTTRDSEIFTLDNNYCCLYIENNSFKDKVILDIHFDCVEAIEFYIVMDDEEYILNKVETLSDVKDNNFLDYMYNKVRLPRGSFCTVWLRVMKKPNSILKKNVHVVVEYIDEY